MVIVLVVNLVENEQVAAAMAAEDASIFKSKKVTFGTIAKAIQLAKGFNSRFKAPDSFTKEMARLEAEGRSGGLRGKPRANVGDTNSYKVNNYNGKKGKATPASVVIPLAMYEWAAAKDARCKVFFDKNNVIITKG